MSSLGLNFGQLGFVFFQVIYSGVLGARLSDAEYLVALVEYREAFVVERTIEWRWTNIERRLSWSGISSERFISGQIEWLTESWSSC